jgi:hypothetical protein
MATLHIRDDTYKLLVDKAAANNMTVESLVEAELKRLAFKTSSPEKTTDDRKAALADWQAAVRTRADRYPPGFRADDARESIYSGPEDRGT